MDHDDQSRNSWINKDSDFSIASNQATEKDGYIDVLNERRIESDLKYALRKRIDVPHYTHRKSRTPDDIKKHVLQSDRIKYKIEMISSKTKVAKEDILKEAESILDEMAHSLDVAAIRGFSFFLIKLFKALFTRVYVNEAGIQRLRDLMQKYPVIFMPSHRSYMDFLLVSFLSYNFDLPFPAIAAAMDFKNMKFFGWLLRKSGAFYIRRSFGSDELYWTIFTEYVQTQLRNGDNLLEFFVEGTRSRTNKSYVPKTGMLSATLESYFKAEVPDVILIPISISYERILEETLYAYELLGIPKPKESAKGIFKARSILSENFGNVHIHLGDPISIRQYSHGKIDRIAHSLEPRYINRLTQSEMELTRNLAHFIVREQQKNMVISPWCLIATILIQNFDGISKNKLVKEVIWLKRHANNLGAHVDWPGNCSSEDVVEHYLHLHSNLITSCEDKFIQIKRLNPVGVTEPVQNTIMINAATQIALASYRNHFLHLFVRTGLIALSIHSCDDEYLSKDNLFKSYKFLEKLLNQDFVFEPGETRRDFDAALKSLIHSSCVILQDEYVVIKSSINKFTSFLCKLFEPFLLANWVLCQYMLSLSSDIHGRPLPKPSKTLVKDAQKYAFELVQNGRCKHYEILSLDIINNALSSINNLGGVYKDKRDNATYISPKKSIIHSISQNVSKYIDVPNSALPDLSSLFTNDGIIINAKL